jgi:hypothetical protein
MLSDDSVSHNHAPISYLGTRECGKNEVNDEKSSPVKTESSAGQHEKKHKTPAKSSSVVNKFSQTRKRKNHLSDNRPDIPNTNLSLKRKASNNDITPERSNGNATKRSLRLRNKALKMEEMIAV